MIPVPKIIIFAVIFIGLFVELFTYGIEMWMIFLSTGFFFFFMHWILEVLDKSKLKADAFGLYSEDEEKKLARKNFLPSLLGALIYFLVFYLSKKSGILDKLCSIC